MYISEIKFNNLPIYVDEHMEDDKVMVMRKESRRECFIVSEKINQLLISSNRDTSIEKILNI